MKKIIALLLAALLCVGLLAACGESGGSDNGGSGNGGSDNGNTVSGETFDAGKVSVVVPDGWKALAVSDVLSDVEGAVKDNAVNIVKGGSSDLDLLSKPYISVTYYDANTIMTSPEYTKGFYEDVVDLDDMTIGSYTWHGYTCDSYGYKYYILWTGEDNADQFQVNVLYQSTGGSFNFDDEDVQAIIASIKPSK